jgi:adenosine deaminase
MTAEPSIPPLGELPAGPELVALPKADLHLHQEQSPRLDRVLARLEGRAPYDWEGWARRLMAGHPPGMPRFGHLSRIFPAPLERDTEPEHFIARVEDLLEEAARDGAVLVEVRFGNETMLRPEFMAHVREAERRVQARYPHLHAEAIATLLLWLEPERLETIIHGCIGLARVGLGGVDLLYTPYDTEADWSTVYRVAERLADAGLGITAHVGEFSTANITAALRTPGLTRLGHAVYAAQDQRLLDLLAESEVTVECCLTCNVVLGAVPSYEEHPIRRFIEHGIPVALGTDNPVQMCTTIGREYAAASALGFTHADLLALTRTAITASFATAERKAEMLAALPAAGPVSS